MVGSGGLAARFSLIDHEGRPVSEASYAGHYLLIYFGFTHCKVVCPRSLDKLDHVLDTLDHDPRIIPLYITVDPDRDTPEVMQRYLADRGSRFTGLTGPIASIEAAKKSLRVFAQRKIADTEGDYDVPHSSIAYLMGPDGAYRAHYADIVPAERMVEDIRAALAGQG